MSTDAKPWDMVQEVVPAPEWYEDRGELVAFARAMAEGDDEWTAARVIELFDRPWRWTDEHAAWVAAGRPDTFDLEAA